MDYFNLNEYDAIVSGLHQLVHQEQPSLSNSKPFLKYILFDLLLAIIIALIVRSIYRLFNRKKPKVTTFQLALQWFSLAVFNLLLPSFVLIAFPQLFGPLSTVTLFAPGIGHLLFIIPVSLLIIGVITLVQYLLKKPILGS